MKRTKKIFATVFLFSFLFSTVAFAAPDIQTVSDDGDIVSSSYTFDFDIKTGLFSYSASVTGGADVDSTYVATVLQRKINGVWTNVPDSFTSKTSSTYYAFTGKSLYVTKGYWYRSQNTFVATKNGVQTKEVLDSEMKWYN